MRIILFTLFFYSVETFFLSMKKGEPPISWQFLSRSLKEKGRNWFINRARIAGIDWNGITNEYRNNFTEFQKIKHEIEFTNINYPLYYKQPFHGYNRGNLNWLAGLEMKAATLNIGVNYWKNVDPLTAELWMRTNFTDSIITYLEKNHLFEPNYIIDLGCSTGISTQFIQRGFPHSMLLGVDLSSYFLSIAILNNKVNGGNIKYLHSNVESISLKENTFDMVTIQFLFHEMPLFNINKVMKEAYRLLKPGGTICILDLNQEILKKKLSKNPFKLWAFEVTEPHIYSYYNTNIEDILINNQFKSVFIKNNDPLNKFWIAQKL